MRGIDPYAQRAMFVLVIAAASGGAACTRAQARTVPEMPALVVPLPPPRLVEPITDLADATEEVPAPETVEPEPPAAAPAARPPAPDPPRAAVTPPAETPAPPPSPPRVLQTIPAVRESAVERAIRADLDAAAADLKRVDYRVLGPSSRANFDQALRFISQADAALREKNFVFAETVASKAATLAAQVRSLGR